MRGMTGGIINIVLGGVMIAGGATGKLVLIGTSSSTAIMVVGAVLVALGGYRIFKSRG
jgi:hypothetical protein